MAKQNTNNKTYVADRGLRLVFKIITAILFYPRFVAKRYGKFNIRLMEMIKESKELEPLDKVRRNNNKLVNLLIRLPISLGVIASLFVVYNNIEAYSDYAKKLSNLEIKVTIGNRKRIFYDLERQAMALKRDFPVKKEDFLPLFISYVVSLIGAGILSLNVAFKEEDRIKNVLKDSRYLNSNGEPWDVVWTPDAIMFVAYQCDVNSFVGNRKFWDSINFSPDNPIVFKSNSSKFIIPRAYALPDIISFEMRS